MPIARPVGHIPPAVSQRIDVLRVVLILGIVVIHVPPGVPYEPDPFGYERLRWLLSGTLFLAAVPALSVLSGYLALARPARSYAVWMSSKVRRLLVPLVLWNAPLVPLVLLAGGLTDHAFRLDLRDPLDLLDAVTALRQAPLNPPLYFLRDLLVCAALTPLVRLGVKHAPWAWILLIALYTFWPGSGGGLLLRPDILLAYSVGAWIATSGWRVPERVPGGLLWVGLYLVVAAWAAYRGGDALSSIAFPLLRALGPVAAWALASWLLTRTPARLWHWGSGHSYAVFLGHAPLLMALWLLLRPTGAGVLLFYVLAPWIAVGTLLCGPF